MERSRELLTLVTLTVMVSATEEDRSVKTDAVVPRYSADTRLGALAC